MKHTGETDWAPCAPGVLHEAAHDEAATRRTILKWMGRASLAAILITVVAWGVPASLRSDKQLPPGLACIEVHQNLIAYARGKIKDDQLKSRITAHLFKCDDCNEALDNICCSSAMGCPPKPRKVTLKPCATENLPRP